MKITKYTGLQYIPIDNSHEVNLTDKYRDITYLAGTLKPHKDPTVTTIQAEPFDLVIKSNYQSTYKTFKMVLVEANDCTYLTMFDECGVILPERHKVLNLKNMKTIKIQMSRYRKLRLKELGYKYTVQGVFFVVETDKTHAELLKELDV